MKLIVLGSGTSIPHPARASSAYWLETEGGNLLLDMSADTPHRIAEERLDWTKIDAVWISHLHLDHCAGLPAWLFSSRSAPETQGRRRPLNIFGVVGLKRFLQAVDESNNYRLMKQPFSVGLIEIEPGNQFEILPGMMAKTFSTPHTEESQAIRLTDKNGVTLVYTSDTGFSEELGTFAKGADLLLMECSFYENKPVATHLELQEAMQIAQMAAPRRVVLGHLYSQWDGIELAVKAKSFWSGETIEAVDGLRLEI